MKIRTNEEARLFESVIDSCKDAVYLVTYEGEQYDLKTPYGRHIGIALMMDVKEAYMEPEIFTNSTHDEALIVKYIYQTMNYTWAA